MSDANRSPCGTRREDLHALHDGALSAERSAALRAHAATCAECGAELRFLARVGEVLAGPSPVTVPDRAWHEIAARLERSTRRVHIRPTLAWAGVSLALAAATAWMISSTGEASYTIDPLTAALEHDGMSTEVTPAAALSYAMGGPLAETSESPDSVEDAP